MKHGSFSTRRGSKLQTQPISVYLRAALLLLIVIGALFQIMSVSSSTTTSTSGMEEGPLSIIHEINQSTRRTELADSTSAKNNRTSSFILPIPKLPPHLSLPSLPDNNNNRTTIKSWGCTPLTAAPFIFVHIGKAGGGNVRARFAAAARNYSTILRGGDWWREHKDQGYYYPIADQTNGGQLHYYYRGRLASSQIKNWMPRALQPYKGDFQWEGTAPCRATTPLGVMVACPMETPYCRERNTTTTTTTTTTGDRCDLVYLGHNVLGSELHWLPTQYLWNWWNNNNRPGSGGLPLQSSDIIAEALKTRLDATRDGHWKLLDHVDDSFSKPSRVECPRNTFHHTNDWPPEFYETCLQPKAPLMDALAAQTLHPSVSSTALQWAHVLSTLPVTRVTVMREPFSWLTSKFHWHNEHYTTNNAGWTILAPDQGETRNGDVRRRLVKQNKTVPEFVKCDTLQAAVGVGSSSGIVGEGGGWATLRAVTYMVYLCGDHCWGSIAAGTLTLRELEEAAAYNLRNSFAVVGLLHETDSFYDMVSKRVSYIDTSLNPEVQGKQHSTADIPEAQRCKEVFQTPEFQQQMMERSPEVAALVRIYHVAVEVNAYQRRELDTCAVAF